MIFKVLIATHSFGSIALGKHDHTTALALELVDVAVHAAGGGGTEGAAGHALRRLCGTSIVHRVVAQVLGDRLAGVDALL